LKQAHDKTMNWAEKASHPFGDTLLKSHAERNFFSLIQAVKSARKALQRPDRGRLSCWLASALVLLAPHLAGHAQVQMPAMNTAQLAEQLLKEMPPLDKPLNVKICLFDPLGKVGPVYSLAKDLAIAAQRWNVFAELQVYTNEGVAANSFTIGQCEIVGLTTLRARQYNAFMGSVDAVGGIANYKQIRTLMTTLMTSEKLYARSINGAYQIVGMGPLGAAYVIVNDRAISSIEKAAGKRVAVMDWDKSQARMVQQLGAQPVASDITNFHTKFNNRSVDIIAAPAIAVGPLELYKGMGDKGGIYRLPLLNLTGSVVMNRTRFEKEIPDLDNRLQKMRKFGVQFLDIALNMIEKTEGQIPNRYWMDLTDEEKRKYGLMMREARIQLTKEGIYHPAMMALLKRVRCNDDPTQAECSLPEESTVAP
jgi:hypothetical protein